jgi:hypothetical protein
MMCSTRYGFLREEGDERLLLCIFLIFPPPKSPCYP